MNTHLRIRQNVDCRGTHLAANQVVARADLTQQQVEDLLMNSYAMACPAPIVAPPVAPAPAVETAAAPPVTEKATSRRRS